MRKLSVQIELKGVSVIAMKRFDAMVAKFENALKDAKTELANQGFSQVDLISEQILRKGGINLYL